MPKTEGIHHVTSISGSAQGNVDFYTGRLGLRLVKRTVNFDDPGTWHLYYGDESGSPGTLITFFPWQGIRQGHPGAGETRATAYAVPLPALSQWTKELGLEPAGEERFGQPVLAFRDTDGSRLELVGVHERIGDSEGIHGFHGVTLSVTRPDPTARLLTEILGFDPVGEEHGRLRLTATSQAAGRVVDLMAPDVPSPAKLGFGSVHHVAFRARDEEEQLTFREELLQAGIDVTPVKDRQYFRSIYFREPGGVLFEIATDPPGMLVDEPIETLGTELRLPPWYESARDRIEAALPPISTEVDSDDVGAL
jgi:glyoxalase family protein